jgi:hypothetical protein
MGHVLALCALLAAAGCEDESSFHCRAPAMTQFSCAPLPAGSYGCVGGPVWRSNVTGAEHTEEPDVVFPVGCVVTVPECGCCYESGRGFECAGMFPEPNDAGIDGPIGPAGWLELL